MIMKRTTTISLIILLMASLIVAQTSKTGDKNPKESGKRFKREENFPKGSQTNSLIGSFLSGLKDVNAITHTFDAPYQKVWAEVKQTAKKFDKEGGRRIVGIDEEAGRVQNGKIDLNNTIGMGALAWLDEFLIEATAVGDQTKVSVTRKVVQNDIKGNFSREWKTQYSNGKIERWLLTQIEDSLSSPNTSEVTADSEVKKVLPTQSVEKKSADPISNNEILAMIEAGFSDGLVLSKIRNSNCNFDTSTDSLIKLKKAGASDAVIQEMLSKAPKK